MNVLFICSQNLHRSKTAEDIFKDKFDTASAGLHNEESVTGKMIERADIIAVMEEEHRSEIAKRFPNLYLMKKIINLDVPDHYSYGQRELIQELKIKVEEKI